MPYASLCCVHPVRATVPSMTTSVPTVPGGHEDGGAARTVKLDKLDTVSPLAPGTVWTPGRSRQLPPDDDSATQAAKLASGTSALQPLFATSVPVGPTYRVRQAGSDGGGGGSKGGGDGHSGQALQYPVPHAHFTSHVCTCPAHHDKHCGSGGGADGSGGAFGGNDGKGGGPVGDSGGGH
eukprot:2409172-Prymnesium_polylepis.5